jgi:hypothetical protein
LGCDGFSFPQRRKPPLNLKTFISSDTLYNSMFFYQQLELIWLSIFDATKLRGEINASGRDPISLYDAFVRQVFPIFHLLQISGFATRI